MKEIKNKSFYGTIGVLLTLFGFLFSIPILVNNEYNLGLVLTIPSLIIGVLIIVWSITYD